MSSVGEEFPKEQARVRELQKQYHEIGAPGAIAAAMMDQALRRAEQAASSGDVLEILRSYAELKTFTG